MNDSNLRSFLPTCDGWSSIKIALCKSKISRTWTGIAETRKTIGWIWGSVLFTKQLLEEETQFKSSDHIPSFIHMEQTRAPLSGLPALTSISWFAMDPIARRLKPSSQRRERERNRGRVGSQNSAVQNWPETCKKSPWPAAAVNLLYLRRIGSLLEGYRLLPWVITNCESEFHWLVRNSFTQQMS